MLSRSALLLSAAKSGLPAGASKPTAAFAGALGGRISALQQRHESTAAPAAVAPKDPVAAANALINLFPGSSMAGKTSSVVVAASIAAYAISKEIYILDMEVLEALSIGGAFYIWYSGAREAASEYFKERKDTVLKVLKGARADHKAVVQERIQHIGKLSDIVNVTKDMFVMSKEIAALEAEAYTLKQRVAFNTEVKSVLDAWVRHEASVRDQEQKRLVAQIISKIKANIEDPKVQNALLLQSIVDVEKIAGRK